MDRSARQSATTRGWLPLLLALASCSESGTPRAAPEPDDLEAYRPRYHVTPPSGFMNDPNGLVHADGTWHLFYQLDPARRLPLEQHWGHAVSRDLAHWDDRGVAIEPDAALGLAFSGSAVVDAANTSGLCDAGVACLVALYTRLGRPADAARHGAPAPARKN